MVIIDLVCHCFIGLLVCQLIFCIPFTVLSEAYHDWFSEAADVQLHVNLLSQNFCNQPLLMRFISFASNIGPAAAVPAGPGPAPLLHSYFESINIPQFSSFVLIADFNINFFDTTHPFFGNLCNITSTFGLTQVVDNLTRVDYFVNSEFSSVYILQ